MSYYANWQGYLYLKDKLSKEDVEIIKEIICKISDIEDVQHITGVASSNQVDNRDGLNCMMLVLRGYDNYDDEEWNDMLDCLTPYINEDNALVSQVEFIGEDNELWRFIFDENQWSMQTGHVEYD